MTSRERTLAILLLGLILLGVGGALGYVFVYSPLQDKKAAAEKLQKEVNEYDDKVNGALAARPRLVEVKRQSLPADINFARSEYKDLLARLLKEAGISEYKIPDAKQVPARAPVTPEIAPKKFAYTALEFKVNAGDATVWQVVDFLRAFYQTELLHQITFINLTRTNKVTDSRDGLEMTLTIEAIILDGAENRRTLLPAGPTPPVPAAVAAVSGVPGLELVVRKPDLARKFAPGTPVLATRPRDYSYIAWKDIFYGVLPHYVPPQPPPFKLDRIPDLTLGRDEKPGEVKLKLTGDGSVGATVVATAAGTLLPEGAVKVDPKTYAITIPGVASEDAAEDATSTVSVVATSADGSATQKGSFKVSLAPGAKSSPPGPDISAAIKMTIFSGRSDGLLKAMIHDAANPFKYEVTADGKEIEVKKFWQHAAGKPWKPDRDYDHPPGVLVFTDDFSSTKRTFKVLAFENDGLIVSELVRAEAPKAAPKGPRPPNGSPRQGPADALAVVAGNPATAVPVPTLYRWTLGKSMKELVKLSPDEGKAIQKRVAADGPVMAATASKGN